MSKWEMVRLGDVASYLNGYPFKPSDWSEDGLPIIRIQDLTGNSYEINRYCGPYNEKYEVNYGDVLVSWSASLGVYEWMGEKALLNQHIFKVIFNKMIVNKRYFIFTLSHLFNGMSNQTHGSTMKHITKPRFDKTPFPLPPLAEQQKIAAELNKISELITKRKRQIEKLDLLVKAKFVEMFGDPVTNPMGWDTKVLSEISQSRLGKMLDAKQQSGEQQYKYLANFNVQWFRFNLFALNKMDFSEKERLEFKLQKKDVLICEGGEVGRCAVWNAPIENCFFQKALHRVRCDEQMLNPDYLVWVLYFKANYNQFADIVGSQATIPHLTGEKLRNVPIMLPFLELQTQFADFVEKTQQTKVAMQKSLVELETLYKAKMQEYFE